MTTKLRPASDPKASARPALMATTLAAMAVLAGCDRRPGPSTAVAGVAPTAAQAGFLAPPRILSVSTPGGRAGAATIAGVAGAGARIRAVTTDQLAYGATAADNGRFSLDLPPATRSRLVAISVESPRRSIPALGWLFLPPDQPARAVLLRPGAGAMALPGADLLAAVDYDGGGGATASGFAPPNTMVDVFVDSTEPQETRSDAEGFWAVRFAQALSAGPHVIHVRAVAAQIDRKVVLAARRVTGPFQAVREAEDWRVDWSPTGGAAQTTLIFLGPRS
jgi:hypothetical protein